MTLTVQARFTDTSGKGVGRWRNYYRAEDMQEAHWCARHLVPKAQVRVMQGREVVVTPRRVEDWTWTSLRHEQEPPYLNLSRGRDFS